MTRGRATFFRDRRNLGGDSIILEVALSLGQGFSGDQPDAGELLSEGSPTSVPCFGAASPRPS